MSEDEKKENLWKTVLAKASNKTAEVDSTLVVFGDKKNGKGTLLGRFREREANQKAQEYVLDYSYVAVKNVHDENEPDETRAHMNVWEIDKSEDVGSLLPLCVRTDIKTLQHTVFMVTLDLSAPWDIERSLDRWLEAVEAANKQLMDSLGEGRAQELRNQISKYNQFFVDPSQKDKDSAPAVANEGVAVDYTKPERNLGVPLLVVGTKADKLKKVFELQDGHGDRFQAILKALRRKCLRYGATLVFTAAMAPADSELSNVDIVQQYIYHRLYDFELVHKALVEGNEEKFAVYVPAGYDNEGLIDATKTVNDSWQPNAPLDQIFKNPSAANGASTSAAVDDDVEVKVDSNDEFFRSLQKQIDSGLLAHTKSPKSPRPVGDSKGTKVSTPAPAATTTKSPSVSAKKGGDKSAQNNQVRNFFRSLLDSSGKDSKRKSRGPKMFEDGK